MKIVFHKNFEKQFQKLVTNRKEKFREQLALFNKDQFSSALNNHPLRGKFKGYRSINITGDLRAIYKMIKRGVCVFCLIDNHNNLYK